jgi:enamine deaminase RidA (YjgF/YER057c/UK114 family)
MTCRIAAVLWLLGLTVGSQTGAGEPLRLERLNPVGLSQPRGYVQVVAAEGSGRWVFVAGQGGIAEDGSIPEDLETQSRLMFEKVAIALAAAGATPADVVRIVLYIVDLPEIDPAPVYAAVRDFFPPEARPASTVVGVAALARPGMRVEIDVTALAPG